MRRSKNGYLCETAQFGVNDNQAPLIHVSPAANAPMYVAFVSKTPSSGGLDAFSAIVVFGRKSGAFGLNGETRPGSISEFLRTGSRNHAASSTPLSSSAR